MTETNPAEPAPMATSQPLLLGTSSYMYPLFGNVQHGFLQPYNLQFVDGAKNVFRDLYLMIIPPKANEYFQ